MIRGIAILLLVPAVGCVTPIAFEEQTPTLSYQVAGTTLVSVVDQRKRVAEGKPRNFIGVAHGSFGIPTSWHVNQVLKVEEGDKERDLAEFLRYRIVEGLKQNGWDAKPLEQLTPIDDDQARATLEEEDADTLLTLLINEWYFSLNLHWVSAFNFDTNTDVKVHKRGEDEVLSKNIAGRDVIDESASESPQNNILRAYRDQLIEILNDEEVVEAMRLP
jgi:hypothetical protein